MRSLGFPAHWAVAKVRELGEVTLGRQRSPEHHSGPHMRPYLRVANVFENRIDTADVMEMNFTPEEFPKYRLRAGDVLLNEGQSPHLLGRPAMFRDEVRDACFQNTLIRFRVYAGVSPEFALLTFRWFLRSRAFLSLSRWTTNIAHLGTERFAGMTMLLAPEREQRRLADEMAMYESRLDAAVAALERVQRNLKRYRASVLQAAVEGRLVPTEAELARKEGRSYEPASKLLGRILGERRHHWIEREAEKARAAAEAKAGRRWSAKENAAALEKARAAAAKKYLEPAAPDTSGLPELPEGWCWASIDQVSASVRNGCPVAPHGRDGIPILRISAVRPLSLDLEDTRYLSGPADQYGGYIVAESDLLFTRYNGNAALVGACARVRRVESTLLHPDKLICVRLVDVRVAGFLEAACNAGASRRHIQTWTKTTAGQAGISGSDIKRIPVPLPPLDEQERIDEAVDRHWSVSAAAASTASTVLARSARLRASILRWAFEGKLVDQDPNDEPASVLLERIKAECAAAAPATKKAARQPKGKRAQRA